MRNIQYLDVEYVLFEQLRKLWNRLIPKLTIEGNLNIVTHDVEVAPLLKWNRWKKLTIQHANMQIKINLCTQSYTNLNK